MKNSILLTLIITLIVLSGFEKETIVYEQVAFNYFVSDILPSDFNDISAIEFKGETENTYTKLGRYKFCLKPEEKLAKIIENASKAQRNDKQQIQYDQINSVKITEFNKKAASPKVYVFPSMHVADKYYVFVSLENANKPTAKYVIELNPDGKNLRSCRME